MFYGCNSLVSIDLSNFDTSIITDFGNLFYNCKNLEYINLKNFNDKSLKSKADTFKGIAQNAVICIDSIKAQSLYNLVKNINTQCIVISCKENWRKVQKKNNTNQCVDNCPSNKYEYMGKCYQKCPEDTTAYNRQCYNKEEKCDHNCKTCIINNNIVVSSICTSCYSDQYLNNGKCVDNCINDYFLDEKDASVKICKCELNKCNLCTNESLSNNLCISCNKEGNYYPKINNAENVEEFIDCYNETIPGYYLDINDSYYKECYISCNICKGKGNSSNHNCLSCKSDYIYILNISETINCYNHCDYYFYYNPLNEQKYCTGDLLCPDNFSKLIRDQKQCIDNCTKEPDYKYEFNNTCYKDNPYSISDEIKISEKYSTETIIEEQSLTNNDISIISEEYSTETIIEAQSFTNNDITFSGTLNILCNINKTSNKEDEEKVLKYIKSQITKDFNTSNIDNGEDLIIIQKYSTITITNTKNQKKDQSSNNTKINLGKCENLIKSEYNISEEKSLYILKVDVNQEGFKIPKIEYEVYYPLYNKSLIKLNLTSCKDTSIDLSIPVTITESLDKINQSSAYYNDVCYTYTTKDGTDISLKDRKQEFINNNLTVCEENCDFTEYDKELEIATCSCKVKTNSTAKIVGVVIDKDKLFKSFTNIKNIANIKVLKCYQLIFEVKAFKNNYGNIIMVVIMFLFFVTFIIFCFKGYSYVKTIMNVIEYFKLNPKEKKNFFKRQKNNLNKGSKNKKNKSLSKRKSRNTNPKELNNNNKNKPNPIKNKKKQQTILNSISFPNNKFNTKQKSIRKNKKQKNCNNIINTNNYSNLIPILKTRKSEKITINNNEIIYPDNLSAKEMYEIFHKINKYTDNELNDFSYKKALEFDKRTYLEYYKSLIFTKHLLFFSFWPSFDYNSRIIKIYLFFFNFTVSFIVNALFFDDKTMHRIYVEKGSFDFIYNIPQIMLSALISGFIIGLIQTLSLIDGNIIELKQKSKRNNVNEKKERIVQKIKIKLVLFFLLSLIILITFWFYLACFCAVYKNTQIHLIKDTLFSFVTSMITPFVINIIPGIFRLSSLKAKKKDKECMFKFSNILQLL